jgi:hypothetical protein
MDDGARRLDGAVCDFLTQDLGRFVEATDENGAVLSSGLAVGDDDIWFTSAWTSSQDRCWSRTYQRI